MRKFVNLFDIYSMIYKGPAYSFSKINKYFNILFTDYSLNIITKYIININLTYTNTFINVTDIKGHVKLSYSGGSGFLKSKQKVKRSMWSRRAQEYEAKISSGKIYELAEVVRDLNKGDDLMVDQSYSERQLFEKAYERILSEFQIVMGVSLEDTQKKLDKALKRNLEGQAKAIAAPTKIKEPAAEPDTDSEPITDTED